jgi:hypothetical protein
MHANHSNICKFEHEDGQDFKKVWPEVQALVKDALQAAEKAELEVRSAVGEYLGDL